jgi:hypothetical protein
MTFAFFQPYIEATDEVLQAEAEVKVKPGSSARERASM